MNQASPAGFEAWNDNSNAAPKLSVLAVVSLVLSILCVFAPIGLICGIAALIGISGSNGRKTGRGLAIGGIIIGVLGLIFWTFIAFVAVGANQAATMVTRPIGDLLTHIEAKDYAKARAAFTPTSSAAITDADMDAFRDAYTKSTGAFVKMPDSLWSLITSYGDMQNQMNALQQGALSGRKNIIPLTGEFANGRAMIAMEFNPNNGGPPGSAGSIINLIVVGSDSTVHWLKDPAALPAGSGKIKINLPDGGSGSGAGEETGGGSGGGK